MAGFVSLRPVDHVSVSVHGSMGNVPTLHVDRKSNGNGGQEGEDGNGELHFGGLGFVRDGLVGLMESVDAMKADRRLCQDDKN